MIVSVLVITHHMGDLGYEKEMKEHMRRIRGDESDEE